MTIKNFRFTDDDVKKLKYISKKIFGDDKNNNTATLKYLINEKYQEILKNEKDK